MAFTDAQKIQIRKYCGYPLLGGVPNPNFGFRFFQAYGDLEFRLINMAPAEELEVITNYLVKLPQLENDVFNVRLNSDTAQAAVWYRNPKELNERENNYDKWRKWLCDFVGCQYGPYLVNENQFRIVV